MVSWGARAEAGDCACGLLVDLFPVKLLNTFTNPFVLLVSWAWATSPEVGDIDTRGGGEERGSRSDKFTNALAKSPWIWSAMATSEGRAALPQDEQVQC